MTAMGKLVLFCSIAGILLLAFKNRVKIKSAISSVRDRYQYVMKNVRRLIQSVGRGHR